jgi:hypothetical protein
VLHLGNDNTYVDLGTLHDVLHNHADPGELAFALGWTLPEAQAFHQTTHSLINGMYQGWDLNTAQLPMRYAANYNFFLKALNCGAITEEEIEATGLSRDEINTRSFFRILEGRRKLTKA